MSADAAYLDTSAAVKLVVDEPETAALRSWLGRWPHRASASILRVELLRAVRREGQAQLTETALRLLSSIHLIRLDDELLSSAAELDPAWMRSLDAIHLASARSLRSDLGTIVTYDQRMVTAAEALGLPVSSPA